MRGYKEEGTTTTPFDMVVLNDMDRFHLVEDVINRVPQPWRARRLCAPGDSRPADRPQTVHREVWRGPAGDPELAVGRRPTVNGTTTDAALHPLAGQPAPPDMLIDVADSSVSSSSVSPIRRFPASSSSSARAGIAERPGTAPSPPRTSPRSRRRSATTAAATGSTAPSTWERTRTRCRRRRSPPRSLCSRPTASIRSSSATAGSRRRPPSPARSSPGTADVRRRSPTASSSPRRTIRPKTAGSSTTRRTAGPPTRTSRDGSSSAPTRSCEPATRA